MLVFAAAWACQSALVAASAPTSVSWRHGLAKFASGEQGRARRENIRTNGTLHRYVWLRGMGGPLGCARRRAGAVCRRKKRASLFGAQIRRGVGRDTARTG